jgi:hypothetical protein
MQVSPTSQSDVVRRDCDLITLFKQNFSNYTKISVSESLDRSTDWKTVTPIKKNTIATNPANI